MTQLTIYNTATRRKEQFEPLDRNGKGIGLYVCGPTVYDRIHIGNARPLVVFDVLNRLLRHLFCKVTYVRNITDVDDKINARAAEQGIAIRDLTEQTVEGFHEDAAALGCIQPDIEPRATDHIPAMIAMIEDLISKGHAYEADGHVLFNVPSWDEYGKFSGRDRDEQIAGARVEVASYKKDPADFVLWKPSTDDIPGWDSPWGYGRPGWHIECSAMSEQYLGETFDIHGGGVDLVFPHHQNEIAQSRCAHPDAEFARYWMHNGYLMSEGEKMSKSLGNFYTVAELLEEFPGEALRLVILKTHYRQPLDFSKDKCREAKTELDRFYSALKSGAGDVESGTQDSRMIAAMTDDLNTPKAISVLHELSKDPAQLRAAGAMLGLLQHDPDAWLKGESTTVSGPDADRIEALIAERAAAKKAKDFARADAIRDDLYDNGIVLEDKTGGVTEWRRE
ncbi:MAG: cysteine--tRNA ligase [Alphaproteobacteria bacterium]